jgi:hypothetical protein
MLRVPTDQILFHYARFQSRRNGQWTSKDGHEAAPAVSTQSADIQGVGARTRFRETSVGPKPAFPARNSAGSLRSQFSNVRNFSGRATGDRRKGWMVGRIIRFRERNYRTYDDGAGNPPGFISVQQEVTRALARHEERPSYFSTKHSTERYARQCAGSNRCSFTKR